MKTTSVAHLKSHLSEILRRVGRGEPVLVTNRGTPIARIEPIRPGTDDDDEAKLQRLEKAGIIRRGRSKPDWSILDEPAPKMNDGYTLLQALLEEREENR